MSGKQSDNSDSKWIYKGKALRCPVKGAFGFVYCISHNDSDMFYVGKKQFYSTRRVKVVGRKNRKKVVKESNWRIYQSSSQTVQKMIAEAGEDAFSYDVLAIAYTPGELSFLEEKAQHVSCAYLRDNCLVDSIGQRRFVSLKKNNRLLNSAKSIILWANGI